MTIVPFTIGHYDQATALWKQTPGIRLRDEDTPEAMVRYLRRNPGLSFVAIDGQRVVGTALSGHDGSRGYLQHVAVHPNFQRQGLAQELVARCLAALAAEGISKAHLAVLADNTPALRYWTARGWEQRTDIVRFSKVCPPVES